MKALKPLVLVAAALQLAGCSSTAPAADGGADSSVTEGDAAAPDAGSGGGDVCELVSSADLAAALGVDAVAGVAADGEQGLTQCTWTFSDTHMAIAQYTADADAFLPAEIYPQGEGAVAIPGATRGWADASIGTILAVQGNAGVLLIDIDPGGSSADQALWSALAEGIAAQI